MNNFEYVCVVGVSMWEEGGWRSHDLIRFNKYIKPSGVDLFSGEEFV